MRPMRLVAVLFVLVLMTVPALAAAQEEDPGAKQMQGQISKIDMQGKTMQVQPSQPGAAPMTLSWSDKTKVMDRHGKMVNISSLKEGDQVRASYMRQDGKNMANKVEMVSPPAGAGAGGAMPPAPSGGAQQPGQSPSGGM